MRILFLVRNFWPELTGVAVYATDLADWLHARGHDVSVVTAPPHYPQWSVESAERCILWRRDHRKNYPILRCPIYVPGRPSGTSRIIHSASFALSGLPAVSAAAMRMRPHVVAAIMPTLMAAPPALAAAAICCARSWLHVQDLEVDAAFGLGILKKGLLTKTAFSLERRILRRFGLVSTISFVMRERLVEKGLSGSDVPIIPNWIDKDRIYASRQTSPLRAAYRIPDAAAVALFSGSLVTKQGLELVIEAARLLATEDRIYFMICGDGPLKEALVAQARGLQRVCFLPLQPAERLNDLLNAADIHLLAQSIGASDLVMPSKLGPMLASGRPVVAAFDPDSAVAKIIGRAGVVVPPGSAQAFATAIKGLAAEPDLRMQMGRIGRDIAVNAFDRETILRRVEEMLSRLGENRPS